MRYTEAPARRDELLRRLEADGYVASAQVAREFDVSEMTIRRDLRQLQLDGRATRVVGGAALVGSQRTPFDERAREGGLQKRAIAAACVDLLGDATTIALDAGTTVAAVAAVIRPGVTVITHSVPVIAACSDRADVELLGIGGMYQHDTRAFAGPDARLAAERFSVDVAVLSAAAVGKSGFMSTNPLDAEMKRAMAASAIRTILLVDSTKIGARAPIRVASLDLVDIVVTDDDVAEDDLRWLRSAARAVHVANRMDGDAP